MFGKKTYKNNVDYQYVYTVHDKVAKKCIGLWYSPTDENMLRTSLPSIIMDYPFRDIEIIRIGRFETNSAKIESLSPKHISLDSYCFPHARLSPKGDDLPLETMDMALKELKNHMNSKSDSSSEVVNE